MVRLVASVGAVGGAVAVLLPGGAVRPDRPDLEVITGAAALVLVAGLTYVRRPPGAADGEAVGIDEDLADDEPVRGAEELTDHEVGGGEDSADRGSVGHDEDSAGDGSVTGDEVPVDRGDVGVGEGSAGRGVAGGDEDSADRGVVGSDEESADFGSVGGDEVPVDREVAGDGEDPAGRGVVGGDEASVVRRAAAGDVEPADRGIAGGDDESGGRGAGRWVRPATCLLAVCVAVWAIYLLLNDLASGLPGPSTAVLAVAATVTAVGVLADVVRPVRLSVAASLVVALVGAAVAGALLAPRLPVLASGASAVEPAALAEQPGERRWTWRTSDAVRGVAPAGAGVVVAVDGGALVALDGPTGAVRWRYARPGAHVRALLSTPDRSTVVAAFAPGGDRVTGAALLVVLDAITGDVLRESTVDDQVADVDFLVPTNSVLPIRQHGDDDDTIRATDLRTGAELWTWSAPDGCTSPFFLPRSGADVVLTSIRCGDRAGIVALDERTGEQRWERTTPVQSDQVDYYLSTSPDGQIVTIQMTGTGLHVMLRTGDGTELTTVDRPASVDAGTHPLLTGDPTDERGPEIVDPVTGERTELSRINCQGPHAEATTASAYLRICGPDAEAVLVWQNAGDAKVTRTPIGWGASTPSAWMLGSHPRAVIPPAPGAIVVARAGDTLVTGYPG